MGLQSIKKSVVYQNKSIKKFDFHKKTFPKCQYENLRLLNKSLSGNILQNFVSKELITVDDNCPPSLTGKGKKLLKSKSRL